MKGHIRKVVLRLPVILPFHNLIFFSFVLNVSLLLPSSCYKAVGLVCQRYVPDPCYSSDENIAKVSDVESG